MRLMSADKPQDEIAEMKRKFKIMNHQIEQLKEEIQQKDQAYIKEHIEHAKADKEKEGLKNDLTRVKKQVFGSFDYMNERGSFDYMNERGSCQSINHIVILI